MDNEGIDLGGAPLGNKNGIKLKDPDIRQEAYKKYCEWLAKGKSKKSFTFRTAEYSCHWQTLESYIKDKVEFDPLHMDLAVCDGYALWEQVVEDSARGINKDANTASLQMLMRNKFSWDKPEEAAHQKSSEPTKLLIEQMDNHGSDPQPEANRVVPTGDSED